MKHTFKNKKISSIVTIIPKTEVFFKDEMSNFTFPESQNLRLAKVMGFNKRRLGEKYDTVSDYAICGIKELLKQGAVKTEQVGAIVVVTTTPDHFIPPTSNIIQGAFDFSNDVQCIDISQGCSGYVVGLNQAFTMLEIMGDKKVLLVTGDFLSQRVAVRDRGSRPIVGDAISVSVIENSSTASPSYVSIKNDGANAFAVYIPAGGTRIPSDATTAVETIDVFGNYRSKDQLVMNGDLVFNFIINEVPNLMEDLIEYAGVEKESIEYFMCHQSSKFTLQKLADRLDVSQKILPYNVVENFGNSSSASVPMVVTFNLSELLKGDSNHKIMLTGFGIGLTWGSVLTEMGEMKCCDMIEYDGVKVEIPEIK